MKYLFTLSTILAPLVLFLAPFNLAHACRGGEGKTREKVMTLNRAPGRILIDGVLDPAWSAADSVEDFHQLSPYYDKEPTRKTIAKVLSTDDALYCLMICFDEGDAVVRTTGMLDQQGGDIVSIMLDTFGDRRTAYKFAVSASGVRNDCRLLDDARNRDYNWDGVWFSAARIYSWGFVIEMEIPYKSLQYDESLTEWGLDFDRWRPVNSEDLYWCRYAEHEGQRISKFGKLVLNGLRPAVHGLNLEIYPVGIARGTYLRDGKYAFEPDAGLDVFYNPSRSLTFQLTANPDFAQIEADPYNFNVSRYESYFNERRPFFTQGNEIFMPAGKQRNTGFYSPMELFYSRRIGRKLPDGQEVPLIAGAKAFGRIGDVEYGGFVALTDKVSYLDPAGNLVEPRALFSSLRLRGRILDNSSIGILYVGKHVDGLDNGVLDIDGAFRESDWQLAYQIARSYRNGEGDYAVSMGFSSFRETWFAQAKGRFVGEKFDVQDVGFVPWGGTGDYVALGGPRWYFPEGAVSAILVYFGAVAFYEKIDAYTDHGGLIGFNMQFRSNWGFEFNYSQARAKDVGIEYTNHQYSLSSWLNTVPTWSASFWCNAQRSYNFSRNYLGWYGSIGSEWDWKALDVLSLGTTAGAYVEWDPRGGIEEITCNARPYFSLTPVNDLNIRVYWDNLMLKSTDRVENMIVGFLFSYNFLPKSWIYLAINDFRDRSPLGDEAVARSSTPLHTRERVGVFKVKYLYYF